MDDQTEDGDIFKRISENDTVGLRELLVRHVPSVNAVDEHGMKPVEHAAYRGNKEMVQLLIDCGARVNDGTHNNGYTALHFAALSGNSVLCQILLEHGSKASAVNSVGRTAAQMAAFVGNHNCVAAINTYVNKSDVAYFTGPDWSLNPRLVSPIHSLIGEVNFHPVRLGLAVRRNDTLLHELDGVVRVLPLIRDREMKKDTETKETIAVKLHLIWHTLSQFQVELLRPASKSKDPIETFLRKLLKAERPRAVPESLDVMLREGVRSFPFRETGIMQQLVTNLSQTKVGEEPGAWAIICRLVNGQKGFLDNEPCSACGEESGVKRCARCQAESYCGKDCQRIHWLVHKRFCKPASVENTDNKEESQSELP